MPPHHRTPPGFFLLRFVAPRGQNRGKVVVGLRLIKTKGTAVRTGGMLTRGPLGIVCSLIALYLDNLWIIWDKDAQTLHDRLAETAVPCSRFRERSSSAGRWAPPAGYMSSPSYAPPVSSHRLRRRRPQRHRQVRPIRRRR